MAHLTDEKLLDASRKGDESAFRELVRRYESVVAGTVIGMLGRCAEADDVGQETFIRFYRSLDKFRGESGIGTYVTRIAINLSINELKRRKRKRLLFHDTPVDEQAGLSESDEFIANFDEKAIIEDAIQKLNPKFRAVIVLRIQKGYSTKETADILKLPMGTVLSRLARAQKKMKDFLNPYFGERDEAS